MPRCLVLFGCLYLFLFINPVSGQGVAQDACSEFAPMHAEAFTSHLQRNEILLMTGIVEQWEQDCGMTEPVIRAKILLKIIQEDFPGDMDAALLLNSAIAFALRFDLLAMDDSFLVQNSYSETPHEYGYVIPGSHFDNITRQIAIQLLQEHSEPDVTFAFLTLYSGNTDGFFNILKGDKLMGTSLSESYNKRVRKIRNMPLYNIGVNAGLWIPGGNLSVIGVKPVLGIYAGLKFKNTSVNGVFDLRFGKAAGNIEISVRDSIIQTKRHQGGYVGLELRQVLLRQKKAGIGFSASAGYDIIDIVEDLRYPQRQTFSSPAMVAGLFAEKSFKNSTILTIEPSVMFLFHKNRSGSPLDGNAFVVKIKYGLAENAMRKRNLNQLGY